MAEKTRWGILATGRIAGTFAEGLQSAADAELVAVGSRTQQKADEFGEKYGVPHRHGSYEALAADDDVDVIYVSTPHVLHKDNTILCLQAGKAVLCEKPFTINAAEARQVVQLARDRKLFLMEAMWTRYLPLVVRVRQMVADGAIGEPRMVQVDFGFRSGWNPQGRLLNPDLGGGSLLDVGVYNVSLASMLLGTPTRIATVAHLGETGVDEQAAFVLADDDGRIAVLSSAIRTGTVQEAYLFGTEGRIHIHSPFWKPTKATLSVPGKDDQLIELPFEGNGYNYEAEEVGRCLREGRLESDVMPLDETLTIMQTLDRIRAEWGLKYPTE
jgi:predicted dehydrogenase